MRYNSYRDSKVKWIGEIPSHWNILKVKNLFNLSKGAGVSKKDLNNFGKFKCILYGEIYTKYKNYNLIPNIFSKTDFDKNDSIISKGNEILIPSSTTTTGIDLSNCKTLNNEDIILGGDIIILRPKKKINREFYSYFLSTVSKPQFEMDARGVTIYHIYPKQIREMFIPDLPENEKNQIVSFLNTKISLIDTLIDKTQKKIKLLKEKRLKFIEDITLNPETKRIKLKYLVNLIKRPIERNNNKYFTKIGMYNWSRGIFKYPSERGSDLGDSSFNYLKEGDLLLSGQFSWEGAVSIVEKEFNDCISSHRFHILNVKENILLKEYLWTYFTSQEGHFYLNENSPGSAGRNRPLNILNLLREKIPVPKMDLQIKIQNLIIETNKYEKYAKTKTKLLEEYRQSLIFSAVTGKFRILEKNI